MSTLKVINIKTGAVVAEYATYILHDKMADVSRQLCEEHNVKVWGQANHAAEMLNFYYPEGETGYIVLETGDEAGIYIAGGDINVHQ